MGDKVTSPLVTQSITGDVTLSIKKEEFYAIKFTKTTIRLPQETIDKLKEIAEAEHRSTNEQIINIIR